MLFWLTDWSLGEVNRLLTQARLGIHNLSRDFKGQKITPMTAAACERTGFPVVIVFPLENERSRDLIVMVTRIGPLATKSCEPGQARKGAAAAAVSCAGVRLVRVAARYRPRNPAPAVPGVRSPNIP